MCGVLYVFARAVEIYVPTYTSLYRCSCNVVCRERGHFTDTKRLVLVYSNCVDIVCVCACVRGDITITSREKFTRERRE